MAWHLGSRAKATLTVTIHACREFQPKLRPRPHPSPRNDLWLKKNPWFASDVLPQLRTQAKLAPG
jgi:uracil-DNA glycosylase